MPNAQKCTLIVCLVSSHYLKSNACATEFATAQNLNKIMVVALDPPDIGAFKRSIEAVDTEAMPSASRPVWTLTIHSPSRGPNPNPNPNADPI